MTANEALRASNHAVLNASKAHCTDVLDNILCSARKGETHTGQFLTPVQRKVLSELGYQLDTDAVGFSIIKWGDIV